MSRVIIVNPTSNEIVDISSVNRRQAYTEVLLLNLTETKNSKDFQKDSNQKVCYNIRLNKEKNYTKKESTKILKLDKKKPISQQNDKAVANWLYLRKFRGKFQNFSFVAQKGQP